MQVQGITYHFKTAQIAVANGDISKILLAILAPTDAVLYLGALRVRSDLLNNTEAYEVGVRAASGTLAGGTTVTPTSPNNLWPAFSVLAAGSFVDGTAAITGLAPSGSNLATAQGNALGPTDWLPSERAEYVRVGPGGVIVLELQNDPPVGSNLEISGTLAAV